MLTTSNRGAISSPFSNARRLWMARFWLWEDYRNTRLSHGSCFGVSMTSCLEIRQSVFDSAKRGEPWPLAKADDKRHIPSARAIPGGWSNFLGTAMETTQGSISDNGGFLREERGEDNRTCPPSCVRGAAWTDPTLLGISWGVSFAVCLWSLAYSLLLRQNQTSW